MFYEPELVFLRETLRKCHIQSGIFELDRPLGSRQDFFVPPALLDASIPLQDNLPPVWPEVIYRLIDPIDNRYLFMELSELPSRSVLVIGPYRCTAATKLQVMEWSEQAQLPPSTHTQIWEYCCSVPVMPDLTLLFSLVDAFAERMWGIGNVILEDINSDLPTMPLSQNRKNTSSEEEDLLLNIRNVELRYACENEIMEAVSKGQAHKAAIAMEGLSGFPFEQRVADPVRNAKNCSIIMNTLLRKAAQKGGVHPVYLDSTSSAFAQQIEQIESLDKLPALLKEMFETYCRLVRKNTMKHYSPPVQKAITYIDSDLSATLNLRNISKALNISSSYLSATFKKETGQTLTEFINQQRILYAKQLLAQTQLQIQTIAQHCGILDVHYFSKVFKRIVGQTPRQYRDNHKKATMTKG